MADHTASTWHLYIIRRSDGALYTGITTDVDRRLREHREGSGKGARSLRGRGPLKLALAREIGSREKALRAERRIKKLSRRSKLELLREPSRIDALAGSGEPEP